MKNIFILPFFLLFLQIVSSPAPGLLPNTFLLGFLPMPVSDTYVWMDESNQAYAEFGKSVCGAGDVNGDGFDDIIIGVHYYSNTEYHEGKIILYYGSAAGINPVPAWQFESNVENAALGVSVSRAGDVNGDGYADIIVGANGYTGEVNAEGKAYVFYGSGTGLSLTPDWTAEGNQLNSDFGGTVSEAGDVNNDGYDDVIIGAIFYDNGQTDEGRVYVYYGSATGLGTSPWIAEINQANATFGSHVSGAGDVNGDGYDDVIIGARKYNDGQTAEGGIFLYYGSVSGLDSSYSWMYQSNQANAKLGQSVSAAGDINNDGYADIIASAHNYTNPETDEGKVYMFLGSSSGPSLEPDWTHEGNLANALFGNEIADAGDVNQDSFDDIIVGSREYSNGQPSEGRAFVFYGSATGLNDADSWYAESNQDSAFFGYSVAGSGDVNNDGNDDIIIGAKYWDGAYVNEGSAYVYLGLSNLCPVPEGIIVSDITSSSATINWNAIPGAEGYKIFLKKKNGTSLLFSSTTNFKIITDLTAEAEYRVFIIAKCGAQFSGRSSSVLFSTL